MSPASSDDPLRAAGARMDEDRLEPRVLLSRLREEMFGYRSLETVGRFELERLLGRGAFGSVYLAHDPTLKRGVAVKVLDATVSSPAHRDRLLREAKALARLEHPNVLTVYDVAVQAGQIVIAMELIEGGTLADWCERNPTETPSRFAALLPIARGTARGLAAAHEVGITHRDIKPANILVGDDGRPRIADFGIARAATDADGISGDTPRSVHDQARAGEDNAMLTHSRTIAGTPAFMAPEQFEGRADTASDQWGLCATLWLAAFGEEAFSGTTLEERAAAVRSRPAVPTAGHRGVPGWFSAVLARGLEPRPTDRWPSVAALVTALEHGVSSRRRKYMRSGLATLAVGVSIAAAAWGVQRVRLEQSFAACDREAAMIEEVWNADERAQLRAGLMATGAGHAATTAARASALIDARVEAWREVRATACRDAVREVWSAEMLDRSRWCTDDRRAQLDAVVTRLQEADVEAVNNAVVAASELRDAQACGDTVNLARMPVPSTGRADIHGVRSELQRARALEATGAYEAGLRVARAQLERVATIDWPPLTAAANGRVGSLLVRSGAYREAQSMLESAYFVAVEAGAAEEAFSTANLLVFAHGTGLASPEDARRWWEHAETIRAQLHEDAGLREATSLTSLGRLEYAETAYERAAQLHEQALTKRQEVLGPEHPSVANSLTNLAFALHAMGSYAEAKDIHERALEIRRVAFGPDHPTVAASLTNVGELHRMLGSLTEATALFEQALQIRRRAFGPEHTDVAASLNNVAIVRLEARAYDEAARLHEEALRIRRVALGPDHVDVAQSLNNLAEVYRAMGADEEAIRRYEESLRILEVALGPGHLKLAQPLNNLALIHYTNQRLEAAGRLHERALDIRETVLGPNHPLVAQTLSNLATIRFDECALPESRRLYERTLRILETAVGPDHPHLGFPLVGLARVALASRRAGALELAERAAKVRDRGTASDPTLAEARFVLAQALEMEGGQQERAIELVTEAAKAYRASGDANADALAEAEAWLRRVESGGGDAAPGPCANR